MDEPPDRGVALLEGVLPLLDGVLQVRPPVRWPGGYDFGGLVAFGLQLAIDK